jgi:dienelactone hydrolase
MLWVHRSRRLAAGGLLILFFGFTYCAAQQGGDPASRFEKEIPLFDLLTRDDVGQGPAITQTAEWTAKRQLIKDKWIKDILGTFPERVPLDVRERGTVEYPDYTQKKIDYATEAGDRVTAYLLLPKPLGRSHAAILAVHPSNVHGAAAVVGLAEDTDDWWFGRDLVRRGFVVLAPDILTAGERIFPGHAPYDSRPFYETHPNWSIMGKMLWDHMRSVDVLLTLSYVDPRRVGTIGWSLGGHNAAFLAAFDERIAAVVSDGGMIMIAGDPTPFRWSRLGGPEASIIYDHFAYMPRMRPYIERGSVPFDFHEIMALIAPRPYLDMNSVPGDTWWKGGVVAATKVRQVYRLYGAEDRFANRVFDGPHGFRSNMRPLAYEWLERWLQRGDHP